MPPRPKLHLSDMMTLLLCKSLPPRQFAQMLLLPPSNELPTLMLLRNLPPRELA